MAVCTHKDVSPVLTIGECEIWGGKETQVMPRAGEFDVLICLLGALRPQATPFKLTRGSRRIFANLTAYQQRRNNVISIDWPDMNAPKLDLDFWTALVADLREIKGKAAIFCMGGHGRTGTALSALIQVSRFEPALESGDVVQWVRDQYCADAVETKSQIDYLERVVGLSTEAKPSNSIGHNEGHQTLWPHTKEDKEASVLNRYFRSKSLPLTGDFED